VDIGDNSTAAAAVRPDRPIFDLCVTPSVPGGKVSHVDLRLERDGKALPPPPVTIISEEGGRWYRARASLAGYEAPETESKEGDDDDDDDDDAPSPLVVRGNVVVTCGSDLRRYRAGARTGGGNAPPSAGLNFQMSVPFFGGGSIEDENTRIAYIIASTAIALGAAIIALTAGYYLMMCVVFLGEDPRTKSLSQRFTDVLGSDYATEDDEDSYDSISDLSTASALDKIVSWRERAVKQSAVARAKRRGKWYHVDNAPRVPYSQEP